MKDKISGILSVDYPELSDDDQRRIQTGELTVLPDKTSVTDYIVEIEKMKAEGLDAESAKRDADLKRLAKTPTTTPIKETEVKPSIVAPVAVPEAPKASVNADEKPGS